LLAILAGLDTPTVGQVSLVGTDLFSLDEDARAELRGSCVGFVFQSFQLLPSLTALENVMLPLELKKDPSAEKSAKEILERVGLGARLGHYPKHLSGGEQQRVALARAFSVRPKLLFADEPTGSLDAQAGESVIDLLFELNKSFGTTLVMVTHDEYLAQRCVRSVRLVAGKVAA
jgi:putative ABC transport system ATP-binding protein